MKRIIVLLTAGVVLGLLFRRYVYETIRVPTASMEPTIEKGAILWVNKFIYLFGEPGRGDTVVFPSPVSKKVLVKRIVGLPGEKILIKEKKVYINDTLLDEPYAEYQRADEILEGDNISGLIVPREKYFLMGDNRDYSEDSRDWKDGKGNPVYFIVRKDIKGKVILR
ncbi:MAG TPA: signal peptidase I [bacterium]|nr:signal peptidase I [bacterium]